MRRVCICVIRTLSDMFYLLVKGRKRRFVGGSVNGGRRVTEIWRGDKLIWPSGNSARRIRVLLPARGSEEWAYWAHALEATKYEASRQNYLRFKVGDFFYYINSSPDGTMPYKLDGDVLTLELGDGVPVDELGDVLVADARIQKRGVSLVGGSFENSSRSVVEDVPMLAGSVIGYSQACWRRKLKSYSYIAVTSLNSNKVLLRNELTKQSRSWSGYSWYVGAAPVGDVGWRCDVSVSGNGSVGGVYVQYPAFKREFNLKIISVE